MRDFIPPVNDPLVSGIVKMLAPLALRKEKLDIRPSQNCLDTLKALRGKPAVVMVNHSDRFDPLVMFALTRCAGEDFYYLAARELFDEMFGLHGLLLQHCGAYSVIRGDSDDEESRDRTIQLMASGDRKLVEFPEGDVSGRDDEISPLKFDGIRNVVQAQRLVKRMDSEKTLQVIPMAIYYQANQDSLDALIDRTIQIENALSIRMRNYEQNGIAELHLRLAYVIEALVKAVEERYGSESHAAGHLNSRLLRVCRRLVISQAASFGIPLKNSESEAAMLHTLRAELRKYCEDDMKHWGKYSRKLRAELCQKANAVRVDLDRMQQLLILESTMRQQPVTLDVAWRVVDRLELQVLGKAHPKGHRTAWIDVGQPIDLNSYVGDQDWNERIVSRIADDIRNAIFFRLQRSKKEHEQIVSQLLPPSATQDNSVSSTQAAPVSSPPTASDTHSQ